MTDVLKSSGFFGVYIGCIPISLIQILLSHLEMVLISILNPVSLTKERERYFVLPVIIVKMTGIFQILILLIYLNRIRKISLQEL